jgi:hypothetical protein
MGGTDGAAVGEPSDDGAMEGAADGVEAALTVS